MLWEMFQKVKFNSPNVANSYHEDAKLSKRRQILMYAYVYYKI